MSIQEILNYPNLGSIFLFGPITIYILVYMFSICSDLSELKKLFNLGNELASRMMKEVVLGCVLMLIPVINWWVIALLGFYLYKHGSIRPGSHLRLAKIVNEREEDLIRKKEYIEELKQNYSNLKERYLLLEERIRYLQLEIVNSERRNSPISAPSINHKRHIMQINKEIERIKRSN